MNLQPKQTQEAYSPAQPTVPWPGLLPCLHLYPVNDSFAPKFIHLPPGSNHVKIGRQTSAKTVPDERNGYFDTKVLSRTHAEVWEEGGKILIKDVKSSNGTFVNGERLSAEATESEPYELKSEDYVEFGIDICGDDNKTIVHHKVSSKVYCILSPQDIDPSARELQAYSQAVTRLANMRRGGPKPNGPNVNDLTRQLANELQKSRDTAVDLHNLHNAMSEIHETLGGGNLPPDTNLMHPSYPPAHPGPNMNQLPAEDLMNLQSQIADTQSLLSANLDRVQSLEGRLIEHDQIKKEVEDLRDRLGSLQGQLEFRTRRALIEDEEDEEDEKDYHHLHDEDEEEDEGEEDEDNDSDDDARSVQTVKEGDGGRAGGRGVKRRRGNGSSAVRASFHDGNEDEDREDGYRGSNPARHGTGRVARLASGASENASRERPSTPEPGSVPGSSHLHPDTQAAPERTSQEEADEEARRSKMDEELKQQLQEQIQHTQTALSQNVALTNRLDSLGSELDGVLELSKQLQAQHSVALSTVSVLEGKVVELQGKVGEIEGKWDVWRDKMEETWKKEKESWESERERMKSVVKEWEEAKRRAEEEEEERRLNEEEPDDDLNWGKSESDLVAGKTVSRSLQDPVDPNGTIGGPSSRALGKQFLDPNANGRAPSSSPETKSRYSSLRMLLNPLYTPPRASPSERANHHSQRGQVPSSFIKGSPLPSPPASGVNAQSSSSLSTSESGGSPNRPRRSLSGSTVRGNPPVAGVGRRISAYFRDGESETSLGDVKEAEENETLGSNLEGETKEVARPGEFTFTTMQLQGAVVVGVAVILAFNYDKISQFMKA